MTKLRAIVLFLALLAGVAGVGVATAPNAHAYLWGVGCYSTSGAPYVTAQGWSTLSATSGGIAAAARDCAVQLGKKRWGTSCVQSATASNIGGHTYQLTAKKKQIELCGYGYASLTGQGSLNWM